MSLRDAVMSLPEARKLWPAEQLNTIEVPEDYLGSAAALRIRLLSWRPGS
jgi:hypothetical protein